jgi:type II secretory pathway pseudopilin PulG
MKNLKQIAKMIIRDAKGVATSLIEATATVAVGAVLAGVAVGGAIDAINDSKIQAAIGDVSSIGQGLITFYKDNAFFPLFKAGNKTGSGDNFFDDLVSENGTYPTDSTATLGSSQWGVPSTSESATAWGETGFFGHKPDYTTHDTIEGHLIRNQLGGTSASEFYPLRGSYTGDPQRGWAGPYIASLPKTDPWGNKYMINVRELHAGHLLAPDFAGVHGISGPGNLPKIAVIVLSAGPNRTIETGAEQQFDNFQAAGDDIVFRIK